MICIGYKLSLLIIFIGIVLLRYPPDWKSTDAIITKVKTNDTVINTRTGLAEVESFAEVVYSVNNTLYKTKVNILKAQPVQVDNVISLEYDNNDIKRKLHRIPEPKQIIFYGICVFIITSIYKYITPSPEVCSL